MTRLNEPKDQMFVKGYEFLSFVKNMCKNVDKNISKNFSGKYSPELLDDAIESGTDSKRAIQKNR